MKFEETKNRLEEYRKKKIEEEAQSSRRQYLWDIVTLQPIRRNLSKNKNNDQDQEEKEIEEIKDRSWTRIDWAIFFVKFLVWACIQVIKCKF